jgi:hypothetical protein
MMTARGKVTARPLDDDGVARLLAGPESRAAADAIARRQAS